MVQEWLEIGYPTSAPSPSSFNSTNGGPGPPNRTNPAGACGLCKPATAHPASAFYVALRVRRASGCAPGPAASMRRFSPFALAKPSEWPSPIATSPWQARERVAMVFGVGVGDIAKAIEICAWIWTNICQGRGVAGEWRPTFMCLDSLLTMEPRSRQTTRTARSRDPAAPGGPRKPRSSPPGGPQRTRPL